eukprot:TRINITY_DN8141_c0_g1_i3.p1 TRINITY_DN8141_c0_g1~~TRINITY_DN8141_c0_g1_i3.p1  ORF type:complete len:475 (+),score=128.50 TRINITY_DN8141_c0_g1_i3:206-1630(+)
MTVYLAFLYLPFCLGAVTNLNDLSCSPKLETGVLSQVPSRFDFGNFSEQEYCLAQCAPNECCRHKKYKMNQAAKKWYHTLVDNRSPVSEDDYDVTLVTFGSFNRINTFNLIHDAWPGPKVAVFSVYNYSSELRHMAELQIRLLTEAVQQWSNIKVIVVMVLYDRDYFTRQFQRADAERTVQPLLPLNTLRNIAVDHAKTNFVFPLDMDFVPAATLYPKLRSGILATMARIPRPALVIPHWESLDCRNPDVPANFNELVKSAVSGRIRPFHVTARELIPGLINEIKADDVEDVSCFRPQYTVSRGIFTSNYTRWWYDSLVGHQGFYRVQADYASIYDDQGQLTETEKWEPFMVVARQDLVGHQLPRYREAFVGRHFNKISFVLQLRAQNYQFYTLRQEFTTHVAHKLAATSRAMRNHHQHMRAILDTHESELMATLVNMTQSEVEEQVRRQRSLAGVDELMNADKYHKGLHCVPA